MPETNGTAIHVYLFWHVKEKIKFYFYLPYVTTPNKYPK